MTKRSKKGQKPWLWKNTEEGRRTMKGKFLKLMRSEKIKVDITR